MTQGKVEANDKCTVFANKTQDRTVVEVAKKSEREAMAQRHGSGRSDETWVELSREHDTS